MELDWKIGIEVELMAPPGANREDLASALAEQAGGRVRRFFHQESEPSQVPGTPIFHNLTLGFEALDANEKPLLKCVDDLTLQADFNKKCAPKPGWYRIVSDDERLLRLISRHGDASLGLPHALEGARALFGTEFYKGEGGMYRLVDEMQAPIAIAAPLPGERERPCEIITPPIEKNHLSRLTNIFKIAKELGFMLPAEGATHLHFDASPLCSALTIINLVRLIQPNALNLRRLVRTNPNCRRIGSWPKPLLELVNSHRFRTADWESAQELLGSLRLSKYCDFNLKNIAHAFDHLHTFEVRVLPSTLDADNIIRIAGLFEAILRRAINPEPVRPAKERLWRVADLKALLGDLPLDESHRRWWLRQAGFSPG